MASMLMSTFGVSRTRTFVFAKTTLLAEAKTLVIRVMAVRTPLGGFP